MAGPTCPLFGICGGCSLQDVPYPEQLERKRVELEGVTGIGDIRVFPGKELHYRNRMDFVFFPGGLGLRRRGTWREGIDIMECPIASQGVNGLLAEVRKSFMGWDPFDLVRKAGTFRYAVIRALSGDSSVSLVLNKASPRIHEAKEQVREFSESTSARNVLVTYVPPESDVSVCQDYEVLRGSGTLTEVLLGRPFSFPTQGFFQNNTRMAERLHGHVSGLLRARVNGEAHLLDLYGGVGSFGIINAGLFRTVTVIEDDGDAVGCARANFKENSVTNARAVELDARRIRELELEPPLHVIADPPRAGMHPKAIRGLNKLGPESLIYVSCNPRQLEKDLARLEGLVVRSAALFDFFPQTPHSESVVELSPKV